MSRHQDGAPVGAQYATILVIFELSKAQWKIGILPPGSQKLSRYTVDGGDLAATAALLAKARGQVSGPVRIASAYEAGFDGFWLHRWLEAQGVDNRVLDPASIQVNPPGRGAKTDKLDLDQLMRVLAALERGEPKVCSVVRPPSADAGARTAGPRAGGTQQPDQGAAVRPRGAGSESTGPGLPE